MTNTEIEKKQIIEAVKLEQDEWVLKAIKRLLEIDYTEDVTNEHLAILNERLEEYKNDPTVVLDWDETKKDL